MYMCVRPVSNVALQSHVPNALETVDENEAFQLIIYLIVSNVFGTSEARRLKQASDSVLNFGYLNYK
jgi:hypothetical protein